jgi:hypothetical protein
MCQTIPFTPEEEKMRPAEASPSLGTASQWEEKRSNRIDEKGKENV